MKQIAFFSLLYLTLLTSLSADTPYWPSYYPVFMERTELEKSVFYKSGERAMENPGKIYYKEPYIYINERYKGVHIVNNSDPANPIKEGFITAPGCIDIAVKGSIMYLDNAVDLVAFDLNTKNETSRIKEILPEPIAPAGVYYSYERPNDMILVGWNKR